MKIIEDVVEVVPTTAKVLGVEGEGEVCVDGGHNGESPLMSLIPMRIDSWIPMPPMYLDEVLGEMLQRFPWQRRFFVKHHPTYSRSF